MLLAASLIWLSSPAHALSCTGLSDRFFVQCASNHCVVSFRARDVSTAGACTRRTLVESTSADIDAVLLTQASGKLATGIYEVTLIHRYYREPPVNGAALAQAFNPSEFWNPRLTVKQLPADSKLEDLRYEWEGHARLSMLQWIASWTIELLLISAALITTWRTTATYRKRLFLMSPGRLLTPLALQAGLFVLAVISLASPVFPMAALIAPVLLLVWVFEFGAYLFMRFRKQKKETP